MADQDLEEQAPETSETGGGMAKTAVAGIGIFAIVLAAQIAAPPINQMLYGGADEGVEEVVDGEEVLMADAPPDISELEPAIYTPLDPPLVVSLTDSAGSSRYLQLTVQAMARNQEAIEDIRAHAPALRNSFLFLISDWTYENIATLEGKEQLRAEMLDGAKAILQANTGNPSIEEIYFTSLVVQ